MRGTFTLPNIDVLLENHGEESNDNIVVVSIIGKTAFNSYGLKLKTLGRMFSSDTNRQNQCTIEGYYDEENQIIYLHAHTLLDTDNFVKYYNEIVEKSSDGNFLSAYDEVKSSFAKILFVLFYISHFVILSHPRHTFDVDYIHYFKAMEAMDQKLLEDISLVLKEVPNIGDEWITAGRMATPRIIFYFEECPKSVSNIKKFEHNLEDRIYQLLRKARIISSNKAWSLFAIPLNEEFVYVSVDGRPDRLGEAVRGLIQGCQTSNNLALKSPYCSQSDSPRSFQKFLKQHIKQARSKGFDEVRTHFELPSLKQWAHAARAIYNVVIIDKQELINELCTESRFSDQRCLKVLPMALARYQEGLPSRYTTAMHKTRLGFALALFCTHARGPMFQRYREQLILDCQAYWEAGRQLCEVLSLTGNPCTLRKDHSDEQEHSSGVKYVAVCDCGRKQGSRDDPYNAKEANFTFYFNLSKECGCFKNERIQFPTFRPSTEEYKAAVIENEELLTLSDKSSDLTPEEKILLRQPSTTEYLPGMLTTISPSGLLPEYQSWALVCLGASSLYSHNLGLPENHHPGFLPNTNYLLPWDVIVYSKAPPHEEHDMTKWAFKKRDNKPTKWVAQFAVKLFIGYEYECPRGHRFMLAAPDKILKAAPNSIVKDKGQKVAESDMPLYFPCLCTRGAKNMTAQLMRLHVVTPKAAVHVKMQPRVQPTAGAPIFVPTLEGPSTLTQAAYWVLRLPYIYFSDKKNYLENQSARLLSGVFTVKKIDFSN